MSSAGIYTHFPFCQQRCHYCSFRSQAVGSLPEDEREALFAEYLAAVRKEAELWQLPLKPTTLYLGGGTPSLLKLHLVPFLKVLKQRFGIGDHHEVTVEANPATVTGEELAALREAGANRLSLGLQSTHNNLLEACGRLHSFEDFLETWNAARRAGFENVSLDLIYGLPGQTLADWETTLADVLALRPEHISLYALTVEEGSRWEALPQGAFPPDEEVAAEYELACELLEADGYLHYELSNWALPGKESRHNLLYWTGGDYLGLGAAAHSHLSGFRVWNSWPTSLYLEKVKKESRPLAYSWALPFAWGKWAATEGGEGLSLEDKRAEALILGLRLIRGVDETAFRARYGWSEKWDEEIGFLAEKGLVFTDPLRLSKQGLLLANQVFLRFLEG